MGALHQVDSANLRGAAIAWNAEFAPLPKPLLVVNIGGPTSNYPIIRYRSCYLDIVRGMLVFDFSVSTLSKGNNRIGSVCLVSVAACFCVCKSC